MYLFRKAARKFLIFRAGGKSPSKQVHKPTNLIPWTWGGGGWVGGTWGEIEEMWHKVMGRGQFFGTFEYLPAGKKWKDIGNVPASRKSKEKECEQVRHFKKKWKKKGRSTVRRGVWEKKITWQRKRSERTWKVWEGRTWWKINEGWMRKKREWVVAGGGGGEMIRE